MGKCVPSITTVYGGLRAELKAKVLMDYRGLWALFCRYLAGRFTDVTINQRLKEKKGEKNHLIKVSFRGKLQISVSLLASVHVPRATLLTSEYDD